MKEKMKIFIGSYERSLGNITRACEEAGITVRTFYNWRSKDQEFAAALGAVAEKQVDFVEGKLLKCVNEGNVTAIIFYLKTKGKRRGYSEKQATQLDAAPAEREQNRLRFAGVQDACATRLRSVMADQGIYRPELDAQIDVVANLLAHYKFMNDELASGGHYTMTEISREGERRESLNPLVRSIQEMSQRITYGLRALGLNNESKERKADDGTLNDFLEAFKRDDDG